MKLGKMLEGLDDYELLGDPDQEVQGLVYDSRKVEPGFMFVALRGTRLDGHDFLQSAVQMGAVAVVGESLEKMPDVGTRILVPDSRRALSKLAANFYQKPFEAMELIGITGTNGKTTTSYILESILKVWGANPGIIGTISYHYSEKIFPAPVTTPESVDLMRFLREMANAGVTHAITEVSSHALDQKRTIDCPFRVAVFTNFSRDHLDYHKSMEAYFNAKSNLFRCLEKVNPARDPVAVINLDDPRGEQLISLTGVRKLTYGLGTECHVRADNVSASKQGIKARLITPAGTKMIHSPLLGYHNIYNILAAAAAAFSLGADLDAVARGVESLTVVPGRLEIVRNLQGAMVVVDYAHTPDALLKVLQSLRPLTGARVITVFGCGGDRDKGKRYEMGRVAGEHSDLVVVTSDNPRSEDPASIIAEIEKGTRDSGSKKVSWPVEDSPLARGSYLVEVDRRKAIRMAISIAENEDIVLIAGKGHEDYQIIGNKRVHFDDREEAAMALSGGV